MRPQTVKHNEAVNSKWEWSKQCKQKNKNYTEICMCHLARHKSTLELTEQWTTNSNASYVHCITHEHHNLPPLNWASSSLASGMTITPEGDQHSIDSSFTVFILHPVLDRECLQWLSQRSPCCPHRGHTIDPSHGCSIYVHRSGGMCGDWVVIDGFL